MGPEVEPLAVACGAFSQLESCAVGIYNRFMLVASVRPGGGRGRDQTRSRMARLQLPINAHQMREADGFVRSVVFCAALLACVLIGPNLGFADVVAPHVATAPDTDTCAMCHRDHTSASGIPTQMDSTGTRTNALIVGTSSAENGDVQLCYACHGVDTLGSLHDVESEFRSGPGHSLTPSASAFGPRYKGCSDCHDSHGTAKRADGTPFPALLRSLASGGSFVNSGDAYCASCHGARAGNEYPGLGVWSKTAHAKIKPPASGTGIVCSTCHAPHGSAIAPNIASTIASPSVTATTSVPANDRRFCEICHVTPERTWEGTATYATSSHGSSAATVAISGEWASHEATRNAGECQSCHAAMGASDGAGGAVPRLAAKAGSALCYDCHRTGGAASMDFESLAYRPAPVVSAVVGYGSASDTAQFGDLHVLTRDATSSPAIGSPRSFLSGRIGAVAAGDVEGTGLADLVVARPGTSKVTLLSQSKLVGLVPEPGNRTLLAPATYLGIADVLDDVLGRNELVTADGDTVRIYRWDTAGASFDTVTAITLPGTISGMAVGRVSGGPHTEIAVTTNGPDRLVILTQDTPTSLSVLGTYATRSLPRGPSIGDLNSDGHGEIAVANAGELAPTLSVYSDTGSELMSGGSTIDSSPTATAIGNVLPGLTESGTSGDEIALALGSTSGAEKVELFARSGAGLAPPIAHTFAAHSYPDALAVGDVDGDARAELLVGLAGQRALTPTDSKSPSLAIVHASADGTTLGTVDVRSGGGVELAGPTSVLAADLGAIGPSRHPVEVAQGAHVSTETAPFTEHVACVDCHNVHSATNQHVSAPGLPGVLVGAWGVSISGSTASLKTGVSAEYEVCMKCHADYAGFQLLSGVRPVSGEFDLGNASFHPVEGVSPATNAVGQTLAAGMTSSSRINCSDCHGNSNGRGPSAAGQPNGPHSSPSAPLLVKPLLGASADDANTLCYKCHLFGVYGDGSDDGQPTRSSGFVDAGSSLKLHSGHAGRGFSCLSCHVSHGSAGTPLGLRGDVGWAVDTGGNGGGSCTNGCHGGTSKAYRR